MTEKGIAFSYIYNLVSALITVSPRGEMKLAISRFGLPLFTHVVNGSRLTTVGKVRQSSWKSLNIFWLFWLCLSPSHLGNTSELNCSRLVAGSLHGIAQAIFASQAWMEYIHMAYRKRAWWGIFFGQRKQRPPPTGGRGLRKCEAFQPECSNAQFWFEVFSFFQFAYTNVV